MEQDERTRSGRSRKKGEERRYEERWSESIRVYERWRARQTLWERQIGKKTQSDGGELERERKDG